MTTRRAAAFWFFVGAAAGIVILYVIKHFAAGSNGVQEIWNDLTGVDCKALDVSKCLTAIAGKLSAVTAYGAVLGLIGLAMQLTLRGEWPTGQLNEGRPKVLDPTALVTAAVAAALAGIVAAGLLTGEGMRVLATIAFGYFAADLATLGTDKIGKLWEWVKAQFQKLVGAK
jgi:hypothetical protein